MSNQAHRDILLQGLDKALFIIDKLKSEVGQLQAYVHEHIELNPSFTFVKGDREGGEQEKQT